MTAGTKVTGTISGTLAGPTHADARTFSVTLNLTITPPPPVAARAVLYLKGTPMPGTISVDTTNETAVLAFLDDHGDVATAPTGAVFVWTSSDTAVATIAQDGTNPQQGDITTVAVGTTDIAVAVNDASGNPILEPSGSPFSPAPVTLTVTAGPAATDTLTLTV